MILPYLYRFVLQVDEIVHQEHRSMFSNARSSIQLCQVLGVSISLAGCLLFYGKANNNISPVKNPKVALNYKQKTDHAMHDISPLWYLVSFFTALTAGAPA